MGAKLLKVKTIVAIYNDLQNTNLSIKQIGEKHGISYGTVHGVKRAIERYLLDFNSIEMKKANYIKARKIILDRKEQDIKESLEPEPTKKTWLNDISLVEPTNSADPYEQLENAQKSYDEAVFNFITFMVDKKTADFKEEYNQLKRVVEEEKHSNLVRNLRRHFESK